MDKNEKIQCVIAFLNEVTCSQSLGQDAAHIMDADENDLYEITKFCIDILKEKLD